MAGGQVWGMSVLDVVYEATRNADEQPGSKTYHNLVHSYLCAVERHGKLAG